jgi:hypothetical protein
MGVATDSGIWTNLALHYPELKYPMRNPILTTRDVDLRLRGMRGTNVISEADTGQRLRKSRSRERSQS